MRSRNEITFFKQLQSDSLDLNVIIDKPPRTLNSSYVFSISECEHSKIVSLFKRFGISDYEVLPTKDKSSEKRSFDFIRRWNEFDEDSVLKRYLSYEESDEYMAELVEKIERFCPNIIVEMKVEGRTYENRMIKSVTLKHRAKPRNPVIIMEAGIHAREWHARSMGLYLLKKLADEAALDKDGLIYKASFVIIPGVNPDGYEFSRNEKKMWRKTRKPSSHDCVGVDGNRNFDAHWEVGELELNPCSDVYKGPTPFSEPETQVIKNVLDRWRGKCKLFVSIHTYGNSIIYPWGWTTQSHPRKSQFQEIAQAGADAVFKATGTKFITDQSGSRFKNNLIFFPKLI